MHGLLQVRTNSLIYIISTELICRRARGTAQGLGNQLVGVGEGGGIVLIYLS